MSIQIAYHAIMSTRQNKVLRKIENILKIVIIFILRPEM